MGSKRDELTASCSPETLFRDRVFESPISNAKDIEIFLKSATPPVYSLSRLEDSRQPKNRFNWPYLQKMTASKIGMCFIYRLVTSEYEDENTTIRLDESSFGSVEITCEMKKLQQRWKTQTKINNHKLAGILFVRNQSESLPKTTFYEKLIKQGVSLLGIEQSGLDFDTRVRRGSARLVASKLVSFALNDDSDQLAALIAEQNELFTIKLRIGTGKLDHCCIVTVDRFQNMEFILQCSDLLGLDRRNDSETYVDTRREERTRKLNEDYRKMKQDVEKRRKEMAGLTPYAANREVTVKTPGKCIYVLLGLQDYKMDNILYSLALYLNQNKDYDIYVVPIFNVHVQQDELNEKPCFVNFEEWNRLIAEHQVGSTSAERMAEAVLAGRGVVPWEYLLSPVLGNPLNKKFVSSKKLVSSEEETLKANCISCILSNFPFCRRSPRVEQAPSQQIVVVNPDGGQESDEKFKPVNRQPTPTPEVQDNPTTDPYDLYTEILRKKELECVTMPLERYKKHGIQITSQNIDTVELFKFSQIVREDCMSRLDVPPNFSDYTGLLYDPT